LPPAQARSSRLRSEISLPSPISSQSRAAADPHRRTLSIHPATNR
jgi:hypothetical protein